MKLGIFTDSHYSSQEITCGKRYNSRSLEKIKKAYTYFENENCDRIICLGDLTDTENTHEEELENLQAIAKVMNFCKIPTTCVMGNHDGFSFTIDEFYSTLGGCRPEKIEEEGKTLLFLDACSFKDGTHYGPEGGDWKDCFLPEPEKLREELEKAEGDVFIFLHQNVDAELPTEYCLFNRAQVAEIIEGSGKVRAVFQGHYHSGHESQHKGVLYKTFPAMCEREEGAFIIML